MAAFMHRGFGRVTRATVVGQSVASGTETTVLSAPITVGLPAGALAGSAGFVQVNGGVSIYNTTATGCLCFYRVQAFLDGVAIASPNFVTVRTAGDLVNVSVTGVGRVTSAGSHTVAIHVLQYVGSSTSNVWGNMTALYVPFGSTGTNTFGAAAAASTASDPGK